MNRTKTALLAALDAVITVGVGIALALVPLTLVWAAHYQLAPDWTIFWRAAADMWLLGNGTALTVIVDPAVAAAIAIPGAQNPFAITLIPMSFTLLTVVLGVRVGLRSTETIYRRVSLVATIVTFALAATFVTLSAQHLAVSPTLWQGILFPSLIYGVAVVTSSEIGDARRNKTPTPSDARRATPTLPDGVRDHDHVAPSSDAHTAQPGGRQNSLVFLDGVAHIREALERIPHHFRTVGLVAMQAGAAAAMTLIGIAALIVAVLILVNYPTIVSLYEGIQAGVVGGIALTVAQLALMPNLVVWAASWLVGPGFAIGAGSVVSPGHTALGPIPGIPIFGALPNGTSSLEITAVMIPVLAGFVGAFFIRRRLPTMVEGEPSVLWVTGCAAVTGIVAGSTIGLLAWLSGGATGPGVLSEVGPHPLLIAGLCALEVAVSSAIGIFVIRYTSLAQLKYLRDLKNLPVIKRFAGR